jgi:hypothetical protein
MNTPITVTEILGFSQTYQLYTGQPFEFPISNPTFNPQKVFLSEYAAFANCQARAHYQQAQALCEMVGDGQHAQMAAQELKRLSTKGQGQQP